MILGDKPLISEVVLSQPTSSNWINKDKSKSCLNATRVSIQLLHPNAQSRIINKI
jgi:hypothetical protein